MQNVEKQRERLISLLKELFQLDQPDLDFGFYRIMHAKAGQVTKFLEKDLLGIIRDAFGETDSARVEQAKAAYETARQQAIEFGAPDPDAAPKVKEAKAAWDAAKDSGSNEGDVYDHLYRFFERYYDNGDFMSRRYFARETDGKAAPYAVPYDGREVYLHWANRDQYYIKTSEYLTNFTFDPTQAKEFQARHGALFEQKPLKVHCRIVSASEGEHNNVKASDQTERFFIIHEPEPAKIEVGDTGEPELVIQFQYRPDPEKTGQEGTWRKTRLAEAAQKIKALLPKLEGAGDYVTALMTPAPTEAEKDRTLLEKYLAQYTGRNTMDYFIHKDLGGFLRRELDFYIKNEVMRLDDIESADAPRVEAYLAKVKVLRRIAQHLIDFLAQLEDFQKRLWLKKKFVVDTQYCITLDRIPEEFYPEIAANEAQREDWVKLFSITEIDGYSAPLTSEFLQSNPNLVIDTQHFDVDLKERLLGALEDLHTQTDGHLFHSEASQAVRTLGRSLNGMVDFIYFDPPYNTTETSFIYKNSYKHASWASMMYSTNEVSKKLLSKEGIMACAIDDLEQPLLSSIQDDIFGLEGRVGTLVIEIKPSGRTNDNYLATSHEYILMHGINPKASQINFFPLSEEQVSAYAEGDDDGAYKWRDFLRTGGFSTPEERPNSYYPIYFNEETEEISLERRDGYTEIWPVDSEGKHRVWRKTPPSCQTHVDAGEIKIAKARNGDLKVKIIDRIKEGVRPKSVWVGSQYDASSHGTKLLKKMFGDASPFSFPKSLYATKDCVFTSSNDDSYVFDGFAGSGTTGHAVIELNREDEESKRKFILAEMGAHFDFALVPRIKKAIYASEWSDGKPKSRSTGVSAAVKCLRLESYEDVLNNLTLKVAPKLAAAGELFSRDYMLRYWLDFETKGSPSLLNIEWFDDPTAYKLKIKKPGTDEYVEKAVDLVETFNWLIGLHVEHLDRWRGYDAAFKREVDPELPGDTNTRLMLDGALKETDDGAWRFRKIEGYTLRTPGDHNDREKALVVWRKLTGDLEKDNLMLDEWFRKYRLSAQDTEFDVIYVNGSNNLPNLRRDEETWKVRLLEEAFHQAMWDVEG